MIFRIETLRCIDPDEVAILIEAGISSSEDLLELCRVPTGRRFFAASTGIAESSFQRWVKLVDILRISGIGPVQLELLDRAGFSSMKDIREAEIDQASRLLKLAATSGNRKWSVPSSETVAGWIETARALPDLVIS